MTEPGDELHRTAFAAAYQMGVDGHELFTWLAGEDLPAARRSASLSLYLRWRRDRTFVFDLMDELGSKVRLPPFGRSGRVLRFLGDLSITIYINNPSDEDVIRRTSLLWRRVLRRRLRLDRLMFILRWPILGHIGSIVSARTLQMALLPDVQDPARFFGQSPAERDRFLRSIALVDPDARLDGALADLAELLASDIMLHRVLGALVIGVHAVTDPASTAHIVEALRSTLAPHDRMLLLLAHTVPPPDTRGDWIPQLESLTSELARDSPETFAGSDDPFLRQFDIVLLPLGLAYGTAREGMPLFEELLAGGLKSDRTFAARMIRGLASVGVYDPLSVFQLLRSTRDVLDDPEISAAFVESLAAIRALHFDLVDVFLAQSGIADELRQQISQRESPRLVDHCVQWIGYYGNAVHASTTYPIMRKALVMDALEALGKAAGPAEFTRAYTPGLLRLLEDSDFELSSWTRTDAPR